MRVKYLGHSSFIIETKKGIKILTDPYETGSFGGEVKYKPIKEECDVVLVSHDHADHNYTKGLPCKPTVITKPTSIYGINFNTIHSYHDPNKGKLRGENRIFVFEVDGIRIAHLGDLGHILKEEELKEMGKIDLLFLPVGGVFTIDPKEATEIVNLINPQLTIPMHYKTEGIGFPLSKVEEFTKDKERVKEIKKGEVEIELPEKKEIWVFNPLLI
jgi:L-ascorbate metabolism protein UlaG (beta-lactamase superfamily)